MKVFFALASFSCVLISSASAQSWTTLSGGMPPLYAISAPDTNNIWVAGAWPFVAQTKNSGSYWWWVPSGIETSTLTGLHALDSSVAFITNDVGSIYKTTNGGSMWTKKYLYSGLGAAYFDGIYFWNSSVGIAFSDPPQYPNGQFLIVRTTDGGETWNPVSHSITVGNVFGIISWFDAVGDHLWFAALPSQSDTTLQSFMMHTRDRGLTWERLDVPSNFGPFNVSFSDTSTGLIAGYYGHIARTTDGGRSWQMGWNSPASTVFRTAKGSNLVWARGSYDAAYGYPPIIQSTDFGLTWVKQQLPTPFTITEMRVVANHVLAVGWSYSILRLKYVSGSTFAPNAVAVTPNGYELSQNFPNPFNPSTTIKYRLAKTSAVKIVVYDPIGREVRTLINQIESAGWHVAAWNGRDSRQQLVSSGTYFYRLQVDDKAESKKMLLLK